MNRKPDSILIVKLSAIGDVVHTIPLLEVLRHNFPASRIDWVVEEEAGRIIEGHEALDRVIVSRRKAWQKAALKNRGRPPLGEIIRFVKELRGIEYDLVIDLQGLFKSGILTGLSRGKKKIGFTGCREGSSFFLTEPPYFFDYNKHALERYLAAAEYLGCRTDSWSGRIPVGDEDRRAIDELLRINDLQTGRLVAVNPVARWKTKLWEQESFASLADRLQTEMSCRVVFTGSRNDRPVIEEIARNMKTRTVNLAGRTSLKELACFFTRCRLLISTDTGPMHMGAAMGLPVVALFGPTAPWRTGPYGREHIVLRTGIGCSPCFLKRCRHRSCMRGITVDMVFEAAGRILR